MDRRSAVGLLFSFRSIMTDTDDSWHEGTGRHTHIQVVGWKGALFITREVYLSVYWVNQPLSAATRLVRGRCRALRQSPTQTNLTPTHKQLHLPAIYVSTLSPRLVKNKYTNCRKRRSQLRQCDEAVTKRKCWDVRTVMRQTFFVSLARV